MIRDYSVGCAVREVESVIDRALKPRIHHSPFQFLPILPVSYWIRYSATRSRKSGKTRVADQVKTSEAEILISLFWL
jgi:hypothetical protein